MLAKTIAHRRVLSLLSWSPPGPHARSASRLGRSRISLGSQDLLIGRMEPSQSQTLRRPRPKSRARVNGTVLVGATPRKLGDGPVDDFPAECQRTATLMTRCVGVFHTLCARCGKRGLASKAPKGIGWNRLRRFAEHKGVFWRGHGGRGDTLGAVPVGLVLRTDAIGVIAL